ncbi:ets DNA-binding protein pokkuri isoform X2 [Teleopsis dalmanni]|nr:ets DNA-binding protein pokkuri isoform X2 [Teleopsis dalmanni]
MKMLPVQLSLNPPLGLWSDVLWRCPPAPPSQLAELKTQLPPSLPSDPRLWGREDVTVFLRFCEREFDLPKVDHDLFQMNGKALCLLTRADFGHRCPGAGDVLHNVLQMLIIESHMMQWHLPNSPVTPTSRYPLSPHSHPPTPTWPPIAPPESPFHNAHLHHFMTPNSVTLSPPPSVDSQASSPPQSQDQNATNSSTSTSSATCSSIANSNGSGSSTVSVTIGTANAFTTNNTASTSSTHSDSDEESCSDVVAASNSISARNNVAAAVAAAAAHYTSSPPTTPILKDMSQSFSQQITNSFVNSWSQNQTQNSGQKLQAGNGNGGSVSAPTTPSYMQPVKREFFPENTEPNTNGRLLWDFLQQLLNDRNQKYSDLIAWKCRDTGVFKIVDPSGLAKLWGIQKNHLSMNYDKMSRALRYYYRVNILRKVQGERHCYQFLRNPTELKNIKNISLLRQNAANSTPTNTNSNGGINNGAAAVNHQSNNSNQLSTNAHSTNWPISHQNMNVSLQQAAGTVAAQQSPQRPSSRSNNHMNLPTISTSAAAAAVAAAAAAYGPPPNSPLFMHAVNGAFHYLSSNAAGAPPNSPAPSNTNSEKFQFHSLKLENSSENIDENKPTDLSVTGTASSNEKRPYSNPSANEDCYPLIRNADGLTTIKLIRYNNDNELPRTESNQDKSNNLMQNHMSRQDEQEQNCSMQMDSDANHSDSDANQYTNILPTDLRK